MSSDAKVFLGMGVTLFLIFIFLISTVTYYEIRKNENIKKLIEGGVDPIAATCAIEPYRAFCQNLGR